MYYSNLRESIESAMHFLPTQGPLEHFVHHNTIHQYEDSDFFDAVKKAGKRYHAKGFLSLKEYKSLYDSGRITDFDLLKSIKVFCESHNVSLENQIIYELLLAKVVPSDSPLPKLLDQIKANENHTKRGYVKEYCDFKYDKDVDNYMSSTFFKFMSAYFDWGTAYWRMEDRHLGLWHCFNEVFQESLFFESRIQRSLKHVLAHHDQDDCLKIIDEIIHGYGIPDEHLEEFIFDIAYRYKGWSALIITTNERKEWLKESFLKPDFIEFITILIVLEYSVFLLFGRKRDIKLPIEIEWDLYDDGFLRTMYAKLKSVVNPGAMEDVLKKFTKENVAEIWHYAYELNLYTEFLSSYHSGIELPVSNPSEPCFQALFCIDDREESMRRYVEQVVPDCETFGVAGHFNLPMQFKGVYDRGYRALCPLSVQADKKVHEVFIEGERPKSLALYGELLWLSAVSSKTFVRGYFQSLVAGIFNVIPFTVDLFFPKTSGYIKSFLSGKTRKQLKTKFVYKSEDNPDGFTLEERIQLAVGLLKSCGLTKRFSPYIFFIGHGSSSLNNPHEAAYNCGACSGGRGAPNGRLIAQILNESEVRRGLSEHGIYVPDHVRFVGGYHDTCNDELTFFDVEDSDTGVKSCIRKMNDACEWNAKERCRRFDEALYKGNALKYVRGRAVDLSITRPEYNHATNGFCVVGPREFSKSLFLDRRAFLVSYDPSIDVDGSIIEAILASVGPVCAGINLEYYFSTVDNQVYGSGTKLPHNITSLVGVMNGFQSDLQLGLYQQMIEIHEPVRLMMMVCVKKKNIEEILLKNGGFQKLVKNRWIEFSIHDYETGAVYVYDNGKFVPFDQPNKQIPVYKKLDRDVFLQTKNLHLGLIE